MKKSSSRYSWGLGDSGLEWMDKMKRLGIIERGESIQKKTANTTFSF